MKDNQKKFTISFIILILMCGVFNDILFSAWRVEGSSIKQEDGNFVFLALTESKDKNLEFRIEFSSNGPCIPVIIIKNKSSNKFKMVHGSDMDNVVIIFPSLKEHSIEAYTATDIEYNSNVIYRKQFDALMANIKKEKQFTLSIVSRDNSDVIINKKEFNLDNAFNAIQSACKECESAYIKDKEFIFYDSSKRAFNKDEVQDIRMFSKNMLQIARNEIFARHGYIFTSKDLQKIFSAKKWYEPVKKEVTLSAIEKANVDLIKSLEKEIE